MLLRQALHAHRLRFRHPEARQHAGDRGAAAGRVPPDAGRIAEASSRNGTERIARLLRIPQGTSAPVWAAHSPQPFIVFVDCPRACGTIILAPLSLGGYRPFRPFVCSPYVARAAPSKSTYAIGNCKNGGDAPVRQSRRGGRISDLFLEKAGFVKEFQWEARLEKTAHCSWDSPPVRVVGYKHWVIYLRVKPSINATVDHFVSLLIPDGSGYAAETVYRRLKGLVKSFNRFVRTNGHKKRTLEPTMEREAIPTVPSPAPPGRPRKRRTSTVLRPTKASWKMRRPLNGTIGPPRPAAGRGGGRGRTDAVVRQPRQPRRRHPPSRQAALRLDAH